MTTIIGGTNRTKGKSIVKLIDADALHPYYRTMLKLYNNGKCLKEYIAVAKDDIEKAPTIDAVPVIRCRDCKHSYETLPTVYRYLMCSHGVCVDCVVDEDFYCAMAERKEE